MSLRLSTVLAGSLLLAGCAVVPGLQPERERIGDFALEARFALRVAQADHPVQSSGGRLSWEHRGEQDRLLLANPIGIGLAEIDMRPGRSTLRLANGDTRESTEPESLIEEVTGQRLPVGRLAAWLLGRAGISGKLTHDPLGRPSRLDEAGWRIDYAYELDTPSAPPARLTLIDGQGIELKLRIEEWKEAP